MLLEHRGVAPTVHPSAYVAPNATLCGDVVVGAECRVMFGAVLTADGGRVSLGERCVVMENAVLRGTPKDPLTLGRHVLVGPRSSLSGCEVADDAFLATGSTVFNGARLGERVEVRVNGVVHLRTVLAPDAVVPIGWVAVGDPAQLYPPSEHERIWAAQEPLDFPGYVFGLDRPAPGDTIMPELTRRYAQALAAHRSDREVER